MFCTSHEVTTPAEVYKDQSPLTSRPQHTPTLSVFLTQFVEDVGGVKAGVVAQLAGDDLQGLGEGGDQQLLLACDGVGVLAQVAAHLHLNGSSTWGHRLIMIRAPDYAKNWRICAINPQTHAIRSSTQR